MATGKTVGKYTRVYMGGVDLSGDSHNIGGLPWEFDAGDATGYTDGWKNSLIDPRARMGLEDYRVWFNNTATTGAHEVLKAGNTARVVCVPLGIRAAPAAGDPFYGAYLQQTGYKATPQMGNALAAQASFAGSETTGNLTIAKPWGHVLLPYTALGATTSGTSINNGAATSAGGVGYLQVFTAAGGAWSIVVEDSADDAAWATILTFTADGTTITAEQKAITGAVRQYVRYTATRTGGTLTAFIGFVRG